MTIPREQIDDAVAQAGFIFDHEDAHASIVSRLRVRNV